MIEFLVVERIVEARHGYEKLLETGRERFRKNQLMAGLRRDPATVGRFIERYRTTEPA